MIVDCGLYERGRRSEREVSLAEAFELAGGDDCFVWVGLHDPTPEEFEDVRQRFHLHELAVEDAIKAHQRPKLEVYDDSLFVVLKPARYDDDAEEVSYGEIMMFIGERFVVSVRHGGLSPLSAVRDRLEAQPKLLRHGPLAVLYAVLDRVVDEYLPIVTQLDRDVQEVEEDVFSVDGGNPTERIYRLKRQVLGFHQATTGLIEPLELLSRDRVPLDTGPLAKYLRDVDDHARRIDQQVNAHRDLLTSILQANLAQVGVRQNEDARKISAWVAIAAVPTLLAGIYGMNFDHMPELDWRFGYPTALLLMGTICLGLYRAFRRSGWL
ncbi:MAG TPA: magnesium/cobalt transporter CorA [Euzebyales bacterium]|nr:magnesium/cobalt transporter CorA [Euzebyales bacterium]